MALVHLQFESLYLHSNTDLNIILPDNPRDVPPEQFYKKEKKYKVLWLLHGTYGDYSDWIRKSNIEVYAAERDLIVVMPSGANANYVNWPNFCIGYQAFDYFFKELMPLVYGWFPASDDPKDNFIAGLSMGGEGALTYMLACPEKFGGCASLSYVPANFDAPGYMDSLRELAEIDRAEIERCSSDISPKGVAGAMDLRVRNSIDRWGSVEAYAASPENLWPKFAALKENGVIPKLIFTMGNDDEFFMQEGGIADYGTFCAYLDELGLPYEHTEGEGTHEWRVWDRDIQFVLDRFGIRKEDLGNAF